MNIKKILIGTAAGAALLMSVIPALAKGPATPADEANRTLLRIVEKNPSNWSVVEDGAAGLLKYHKFGPRFNYEFKGNGLQPNTNYSLIYYADPWPGNNPGALIAAGTSNNGGEIHLAGSNDLGLDLPDPADGNYPGGAKIWLVLSSDYDASTNSMVGWNPTEYLFEYNLISYDDTDV